ncbi:4414_t:CDS:1, partial [Gigaspora margarita]
GNNISKNSDKPTEHAAIMINIFKIDSNTKTYINTACQNTANMIIASIKANIDQNGATQSATIDKLNKCINQCFDKLQPNKTQQQPLSQHEKVLPLQHNHDLETTLP